MSSEQLRIAYWCQFFWPEGSAPSRRLLDLGREWIAQGHQVTVVTGMPNHPTGIVPVAYRGRLRAAERKDGIRVLRSWVYASPNHAGFRKFLGHLSFAVSSLFLSAFRQGKVDVVIASSPTFFVVISAWIAARLRRAAFVFEVRDLWPEVFVDLGAMRPGLAIRVFSALVRFMYRRADLIVTVTESFKERIAGQGIAPAKIAVVTNGADVDWFGADVTELAIARRQRLRLDGHFVVSYIGAHGVSHGLQAVLQAAELLQREDGIRFLLVGDGAERERLERYRDQRQLANVLMLQQQPPETIREFYALSDVCLVPLRDILLFETFIPSKMFEIMASGRPMIASVRGEPRRILEASGAAVLIEPEDPDELAAAVRKLRSDRSLRERLGASGRAFVSAHYSRRSLACSYARLLSDLTT